MIDAPPAGRRTRRLFLAVLSGAMLGCSFPPFHLGILASFGLVPLLVALRGVNAYRAALGYVYAAMLVFHAITVNWTGGYAHGNDPYMMIAGTVTIVVHPLFYLLPMGIYLVLRRHQGEAVALAALPLLWVGYEYSHSLSEWSFPWLTLGNSQTYDLARVQFIAFTGVWGLSLWILLTNVLAFVFCLRLATVPSGWKKGGTWVWGGALTILYVLPSVYGQTVLSASAAETGTEKSITIGIVQSNVDPWAKWTADGYDTYALYLRLTGHLLDSTRVDPPDMVLWPETALPFDVLGPNNREFLAALRERLGEWHIGLLTGLPHKVVYEDSLRAPGSARTDKRSGVRYDWFNAAAYIVPGDRQPDWYGKMKMVPFAERVPYANIFQFFDFLRWDVGIGGWQIGPDTTIFLDPATGARFSTLICYESTYPGFVAEFVRRGAEFLTLITIDSWWDHMSGAYQHQQIAVLRAVENRRWIARCAVGGISGYIDPYGRVHDTTELFTQRLLSRTIERRTALSFYTEHGDWLGEICLWLAVVLAAGGWGQAFVTRKRNLLWQAQQ